MENISRLVTTTVTARPATFDAMAASTAGGLMLALEPNPPPTYSATTWTPAASRPNSAARTDWIPYRTLIRIMHDQPTIVPIGGGRVGFHRVVVLSRRGIPLVDSKRRLSECGIHITGMSFAWKIGIDVVWRIAARMVRAEDDVGGLDAILEM